MKKKLIVILGPTASGKTELGLYLAKKFNGEIICADSRTIYKGMKIGTASPCLSSKFKVQSSKWGDVYLIEKIPHYLLHFKKPDETFTVAQFQEMAYKILEDILRRGKIPFLVGGTGLYIEALTKGLSIPRVPPDPILRKKLEKRSCENLYQELQKIDPKAAKKILVSNKRRIIRALEVCLKTGQKFSGLQKIKKPPYEILTLGIEMPREKLYEKINKRVDKMIKMGLVEEVKKLLKKGYSLDLPSMSGLGYKQIGEFLVKNPNHPINQSSNHLIEQIKRDTRHFARRQISWFSAKGGSASGGKRDKSIKWVRNKKEAERLVKSFVELSNTSSL